MNSTTVRHKIYLLSVVLLTIASCGGDSGNDSGVTSGTVEKVQQAPSRDLESLLASDVRAEADRARDEGRKPARVIEFLGIKPGMKVIDIIAASGYYTEVLSLAVGPDGRVASQNPAGALRMRDGANDKALTERLANNRLPNVYRLDKELSELSVDDGPFDAAITALNLHDVYNNGGDEAAIGMMRSVYDSLKPGGVFGVIDHDAVAGNDNKALHRIQKADAVRIAEAAGFVVEAERSILQNPDDDMTQFIRAEGLQGHTNRFLLKLRKPTGQATIA